MVEATGTIVCRKSGYVQVYQCGVQISMPHGFFNTYNVLSGFQLMGSEGMPESMYTDFLVYPGLCNSLFKQKAYTSLSYRYTLTLGVIKKIISGSV